MALSSICTSVNIIVDAEYAKSLEEKEAKAFTESTVPSLHEIMDMEMALAIYNNDMVS